MTVERDLPSLQSELFLKRSQIAGLRDQIPYAVRAQIAACIVMAALTWGDVPVSHMLLWVGYFAVSYGWSVWAGLRATSTEPPDIDSADHMLAFFTLLAVVRASAWPLAAWLLAPHTIQYQMGVEVISFAILSGAITTYGSHFPAVVAFAITLTVPMAASLLWVGGPFGTSFGIGTLVYIPLYLGAVGRAHPNILDNYRLKFRNDDLLLELQNQASAEARAKESAHLALASAEQASQDKTRFLAAASHDLRQPIHAIGLFVTALKREQLEGRVQYLVERLDRSLAGLDELFDRLLDMSRLDAGVTSPHLEHVHLSEIVGTLDNRFSPLAQERGLRFAVSCANDHCTLTDPGMLTELLSNLLSNAFRYTDQGGIVLGVRPRGEHLAVQVWDSGKGIAAQDLDRIFDEFVQLDNSARDRRRGLGLGLALVKRMANALGHPYAVRSTPGRGSVFEVLVPRLGPPDAVSGPDLALADLDSDIAGALILVVDDEDDILEAMAAVLSSWGCLPMLATSGAHAVQCVDASPRYPDVLITDHRLANHESSFDVVRAVRESLPSDLPVIVVSGEPGAMLEPQMHERGWQFINKPVGEAALRAALVNALSRPVDLAAGEPQA